MRRVHDATRTLPTPIRSQGDTWFREHTFDFCLRPTGHRALLDAYTAPGNTDPARDPLTATVTAGVVLYRLATHVVPYPLTAPPGAAHRFRDQVTAQLDRGTFTLADLLHPAAPDLP
ncbi:hypothetical protein ACFC26_30935 [Kitasatospora purpeofusca]|uniref:hypothetical protein n=1 Tax=Kitasatospora purpeofusca TaxID=67352 RepID=UPI0035E01941